MTHVNHNKMEIFLVFTPERKRTCFSGTREGSWYSVPVKLKQYWDPYTSVTVTTSADKHAFTFPSTNQWFGVELLKSALQKVTVGPIVSNSPGGKEKKQGSCPCFVLAAAVPSSRSTVASSPRHHN